MRVFARRTSGATVPTGTVEGALVTLERVPEVVDAAWWLRAHLFRNRGEAGGLRFEAGLALELPARPQAALVHEAAAAQGAAAGRRCRFSAPPPGA